MGATKCVQVRSDAGIVAPITRLTSADILRMGTCCHGVSVVVTDVVGSSPRLRRIVDRVNTA